MKIFIIIPANEADRAFLLERLPEKYSVIFKEDLPEEKQFDAYAEADILLGNASLGWLERKHNHLKWWQIESAGFDKFKHLSPHFPVTNVGDYYAQPCAETIVGGVLALYRKIDTLVVLQKTKKWIGVPLRLEMKLLSGQKVIILGAGEIGKCVKNILHGFNCKVTVLARNNPDADIHSVNELKAILPETDLVISCLPGTADGFFTKEMIGLMKSEAVFANVGRGNTVDEKALTKALSEGKIEGAVLDVTEIEPLPANNTLWELPNVLILQHTGGGQRNEHRGKFRIFLKNLTLFESGKKLNNEVELGRGY
ncbi:MAG: glyoxylate/hydroxypyruvate reductase A [Spirosomataceae bacterium]|jgi:phosphoglycerate dehydrogenase-like enzyme